MPVTLNPAEIRHRAHHFSKEFADAHYELGEAQNFIRGLCDVFGFSNKRLVSFEQRVKKLDGRRGRIVPRGWFPWSASVRRNWLRGYLGGRVQAA